MWCSVFLKKALARRKSIQVVVTSLRADFFVTQNANSTWGGGQKTLAGADCCSEWRREQISIQWNTFSLSVRSTLSRALLQQTQYISQMVNVEERVHNGSVYASAHMNKVTRHGRKPLSAFCSRQPRSTSSEESSCTFMARCRSDAALQTNKNDNRRCVCVCHKMPGAR